MAFLFGDTRPDGKIRVWRTTHRMPVAQGSQQTREVTEADAPLYPDGWWFDDLPEPPPAQPGINLIMLFQPGNKQFSWETEERPWTSEETMQHKVPVLEARLAELEKATGTGNNPGEKGIAKRVDTLADRIAALEAKVG